MLGGQPLEERGQGETIIYEGHHDGVVMNAETRKCTMKWKWNGSLARGFTCM